MDDAVLGERVARRLADHFGFREFDEMAWDRATLRSKVSDGYDVNEPTQDDCREAAEAVIALITAARRPETRDWSKFEDDISDAISDSIDMDWSSRDGAKAVVALLNKAAPPPKTETAWLIEWPATRQDVVRYWHPTEGHVIDPNHAVRFAREEDAAAVCKRDQLGAGARPVEHIWVSK